MADPPGTGLPADARRRLRPRLHRMRPGLDAGQSTETGDQLDEQPGSGDALDLLVLGALPLSKLPGGFAGVLRGVSGRDLEPRGARGTLPLVLLLAEHSPHRGGAQPLL